MNASTACVTKRVASTGLGKAYGPAATGVALVPLGHTSASTTQRSPSSTARSRATEAPVESRVADVELAASEGLRRPPRSSPCLGDGLRDRAGIRHGERRRDHAGPLHDDNGWSGENAGLRDEAGHRALVRSR